MKNILVLILTSSKYYLLERSINSVLEQEYNGQNKYTLKIVVNTLNDDYYKLVMLKQGEKFEIIRTLSNGRPGKGHNSLFQYFSEKEQEVYDYLLPIDGDDMLYPVAFTQMDKFIIDGKNPDIIHLMINDNITPRLKPSLRNQDLIYDLKLYSCFNDHQNWITKTNLPDIFNKPVHECKTPSRIILASRNIFTRMTVKLVYSEELYLYDDITAFCSVVEGQLRNEIRTFVVSESNIYLYDAMNDHSFSHTFGEANKISEELIFRELIKKYKYFNNWKQLELLPFIDISLPENFDISRKKKFCVEKFVLPILNHFRQEINMYPSEIKNYKEMISIGYYDSKYLNILINHYLKNNDVINSLIYCKIFEKWYPCEEVYRLLFKVYGIINNVPEINKYYQILQRYSKEKEKEEDLIIFNKKEISFPTSLTEKRIPLQSKILCYYVGYSPSFTGRNYKDRSVWGSEIAAVKLCEELALRGDYTVVIFNNTEAEDYYNGVYYFNYNTIDKFCMIYNIDIMIISRFTHYFLDYPIKCKKLYFLLHDTRCHGLWNTLELPDYAIPLFYNFIEKIDKVILVSEWQKENFKKILSTYKINISENKMKIIPNGINPELFKNKNEEGERKLYRFIYHSNPERGLLELCKILTELREIYNEITLDIYFDKITDNNILDFIKDKSFIKFHGKISNDKIIEELQQTTLWVYPNVNSHETFCIAALEAMASGNIPITLDYSGLKNTLGDNCGFLIPKDNKLQHNFIKVIKLLFENKKLRYEYINKSLTRAKNYSWKNVVDKWYEL